MIVHIVMWNLKEEAAGHTKGENCAIIKEGLEALVGKIEGLLAAQVGINHNPQGMDLCLYSQFSDQAALDAYQAQPLHQQVKDFVHQVAAQRVVCDYQA